jgi:hypothetical protein
VTFGQRSGRRRTYVGDDLATFQREAHTVTDAQGVSSPPAAEVARPDHRLAWMLICLVAALAVGLLVVVKTTLKDEPAVSKEAIAELVADGYTSEEAVFLLSLYQDRVFYIDNDVAIATGRAACAGLATGADSGTVTRLLVTDAGYSYRDADLVADAAAVAFCPEYAGP